MSILISAPSVLLRTLENGGKMATINNLHKSISEMSDDELLDLLKQVRASRRITKATTKPRNATSRKPAAPPKGLTQEAKAALILELEEMLK